MEGIVFANHQQRAQRQQLCLNELYKVVVHQLFVVCGADYGRVERPTRVVATQASYYGGKRGGIAYHSDFDHLWVGIVADGINLPLDDRRWDVVEFLYAKRVLQRQAGDDRHGFGTKGGDGSDVGLYACATGAVGACDGKNGMRLHDCNLLIVGAVDGTAGCSNRLQNNIFFVIWQRFVPKIVKYFAFS